MITLFGSAKYFKFVSFLLYVMEVKRLKCAMLGAYTVNEIKCMRIIKHKSVQTRKINKISEHMYLLTFSFHLGQTGSLSLSAINFEAGISENKTIHRQDNSPTRFLKTVHRQN